MSAYILNQDPDHLRRLNVGLLDAHAALLGLPLYSTLMESTVPVDDKGHPRFRAGYDAGMKDGRASERAARDEARDQPTQVWRCFHCDLVFTDSDAAMEHFGRTERQDPACTIDIAEYRAMEQRMLAYNQEDGAIHREMNAKLGAHQLALVREEERGYSRGIRDAKRYPAQLGLQPIPVAAVQTGDDPRQKDGVA